MVLTVVGAVVWSAAYSPLGFQRFALADADRVLGFSAPGTYVVYEEFAGASTVSPASPLEVLIEPGDDDAGEVRVEPALEPGDRGAPHAYRLLGYEGRALAVVEVDDSGSYWVQVRSVEPGRMGAARVEGMTIAVGRGASRSWLGTWAGAVALVGIPLTGAVISTGAWMRLRRRRTDSEGISAVR